MVRKESVEVPPSVEQTEELWEPPIDLSHLEEDEQSVVREILREEADAFARDENEVGCIDNLELNINLADDKPVQKNYVSIPKPLYGEVKEYTEGKAYHQGFVAEKSRPLTAFVTPWGLYQWNRIPFGLMNAKLSAVGRWVAKLADFNFRLRYRPGKMNTDADFLSRLPLDPQEYMESCMVVMEKEAINATIQAVTR